MTKSLLIEIGVEELPAIPLLKIVKNIEKSWQNILETYRLSCDFEFIYTPRRLVLKHPAIPTKQEESTTELFGPPIMAAMRDGAVTKAGEGFARKCGVAFEALGRAEKGGKEVLYYKKEEQGSPTTALLQTMLEEWLASMAFGKMMRWGSRSDEFIRPLRWLQVRMDNESVEVELFGVQSATQTYLHRMVSFEPVEVEEVAKYDAILAKGMVSLYPEDRKTKILAEFEALESEHGISIERDHALLDEVVAITENPKALLGGFDALFLELPPEAIIASMKEHQRYFPVFEDGNLSNKFVVVSNAVTDDYSKVVAGNERVLKPRLADGLFFYRNDLKRGLVTDGLEKITFMDGLGSLVDKIDRERKIANFLLKTIRVEIGEEKSTLSILEKLMRDTGKSASALENLMNETISLAKADLTSEMVYEFTELQGLMGYYYAKALGKDSLVYNAIKEQYFPLGEGAELPSSLFSSIVAVSIKLDTLIGLFSIGKIPTGSKDPFALRRAVNGIVRIMIDNKILFKIDDIQYLSNMYHNYDTKKLEEFIIERIKKSLKAVNPSIISAVLMSSDKHYNKEIYKISERVNALNEIVLLPTFKEQFSTFKRVANISKELNLNTELNVDTSLFSEEIEHKLYKEYKEKAIETIYFSPKDYLLALFSLKETLDRYFDNVMVNVENKEIRENRQNTIGNIYQAIRKIADIKEISI